MTSGSGPQRLIDLGAIARLLVLVDQAASRAAGRLEDPRDDVDVGLGERRLRPEEEHLLGAQFDREVADAGALQGHGRRGPEDVALMRKLGDAVGARRGEQDRLAFPAQRRDRRGHG